LFFPNVSDLILGIVELGVKDFKQSTGKIQAKSIGCYIEVNGNVLDVINLGEPKNTVKIPLVKLFETIRVIVKNVDQVDKKYGKVILIK